MKKTLCFAIVATATIALFSCKKKNSSSPSLEQLQQQNQNALDNASSAEKIRNGYILTRYSYKGKVKTVSIYDSLKQDRRKFTAFNQAGYTTLDSSYEYRENSNEIETYEVLQVSYDNNNFITSIVGKYVSQGIIFSTDSTLYIIQGGENMVEETWEIDRGLSWIPKSKHSYTYAGKGKVATDTSFEWNKGRWQYDEVAVNEYQDGKLTQTIVYPVRAATVDKNPDVKYTYEYDAQGNEKVRRNWDYDDALGKLVIDNTYFTEITYW